MLVFGPNSISLITNESTGQALTLRYGGKGLVAFTVDKPATAEDHDGRGRVRRAETKHLGGLEDLIGTIKADPEGFVELLQANAKRAKPTVLKPPKLSPAK